MPRVLAVPVTDDIPISSSPHELRQAVHFGSGTLDVILFHKLLLHVHTSLQLTV